MKAGIIYPFIVSTHSRPKAAVRNAPKSRKGLPFQHTAARRRLKRETKSFTETVVSTHSRPKAAVFCISHDGF